MHNKQLTLLEVIECMRCKEDELDVKKLHSAIDNAAIVGVVVAHSVFQFEIFQLAKDQLDSFNIESWAELLMKDGIPTSTLSRRLVCLRSDEPLVNQTQEQLIFDALVTFSKSMEFVWQLAVMVREAKKHKSELETKVVTEVEDLVEIIPMPTDSPFTLLSEDELVLLRQKARGTGKLIRQFG